LNRDESFPNRKRIVLPPHGSVELVDYYGDDLGVVNAARVSFNKESKWEPGKVLNEKDKGLINYLFKNDHPSPIRHNGFTWRIKAPIFVVREIQKHVIATAMNEVSLRYSEAEEEFYVPDISNVRTQVGKPGAYSYQKLDENDAASGLAYLRESYDASWASYEKLLKLGWAKEQARMVLPVGVYSTIIFSGNANCALNFFALRSAPDAQREIQLYSQAMEDIFRMIMPETYSAWESNGRKKL
jgi:thymidylate synthase (FAD)